MGVGEQAGRGEVQLVAAKLPARGGELDEEGARLAGGRGEGDFPERECLA